MANMKYCYCFRLARNVLFVFMLLEIAVCIEHNDEGLDVFKKQLNGFLGQSNDNADKKPNEEPDTKEIVTEKEENFANNVIKEKKTDSIVESNNENDNVVVEKITLISEQSLQNRESNVETEVGKNPDLDAVVSSKLTESTVVREEVSGTTDEKLIDGKQEIIKPDSILEPKNQEEHMRPTQSDIEQKVHPTANEEMQITDENISQDMAESNHDIVTHTEKVHSSEENILLDNTESIHASKHKNIKISDAAENDKNIDQRDPKSVIPEEELEPVHLEDIGEGSLGQTDPIVPNVKDIPAKNSRKTEGVEPGIKTNADKLDSSPKTDHSLEDSFDHGSDLFNAAEQILNQTKKDYKRAYELIAKAADVGHIQAMMKAAYAYLVGDYLTRNFSKSIELYQTLADQGFPIGQQGLGFLYGSGSGVNSSQAKALVYTTFAALGGEIKSQMNLGYRYWGGVGVVQNCESALTYYKKVSRKVAEEIQPMGSPAVHRIRLYDELEQGTAGGNLDDDLLQYYQFLADKGDVQAQVGLGQLYFQGGRGVDVDHQKAFQYFKQAATAGNANAQAYLGKMYLEGAASVPQDNETAYAFFVKAVDQGNPLGHSGLGLIFMHGSGVDKDYSKAMSYFSLASEQGLPEAQLQLGNLYYHGLGVNRDYQRAVKYFTLASQSGNVLALYNLASMHANGNGVIRSCHTSTELFKSVAERGKWSSLFTEAYVAYKAGDIDTALLKYYLLAELGYEAAQSNVAYILEKGESSLHATNETFSRALLQWIRAASQGYTVARVKVGDYHFYGLGTVVDYELAALHYRLASEQQSNAQAMFNLGYMHEQGLGLKKDIHLAKRFYDMAAESNPDAQVPVTLALVKLGAYFTAEWANKNYKFWQRFNIRELLGNDWDLYVITALAVFLGFILLVRRR